MKNDCIPRKENDLLVWHDRFLAGATAHGTVLGLTAPNLAAITVNNEDLHGTPGPVFLARDTASPYVDNRPLLVAGKPEVREYCATYVLSDAEIGNSGDGAVITAAP